LPALADEDVAVTTEVQALAVARQCRACLAAGGVDASADVFGWRPGPRQEPGERHVDVLGALDLAARARRRTVRAEHHFKAAGFSLAHIGHQVLARRAQGLDDLAAPERSVLAHSAHPDVLVIARSVRGVEQEGAIRRFDQRRAAFAAGSVRSPLVVTAEVDRLTPAARRALPRYVHIPVAARARAA